MEKELHIALTVKLFTDVKCFGPGVAELMHRVDTLHSLRSAALSMDMSYSKAWTVMRNAERGLGCKLLSSTTGGKNGGGALLTEEGQQFLSAYEELCRRISDYGQQQFSSLFAFFIGREENDL